MVRGGHARRNGIFRTESLGEKEICPPRLPTLQKASHPTKRAGLLPYRSNGLLLYDALSPVCTTTPYEARQLDGAARLNALPQCTRTPSTPSQFSCAVFWLAWRVAAPRRAQHARCAARSACTASEAPLSKFPKHFLARCGRDEDKAPCVKTCRVCVMFCRARSDLPPPPHLVKNKHIVLGYIVPALFLPLSCRAPLCPRPCSASRFHLGPSMRRLFLMVSPVQSRPAVAPGGNHRSWQIGKGVWRHAIDMSARLQVQLSIGFRGHRKRTIWQGQAACRVVGGRVLALPSLSQPSLSLSYASVVSSSPMSPTSTSHGDPWLPAIDHPTLWAVTAFHHGSSPRSVFQADHCLSRRWAYPVPCHAILHPQVLPLRQASVEDIGPAQNKQPRPYSMLLLTEAVRVFGLFFLFPFLPSLHILIPFSRVILTNDRSWCSLCFFIFFYAILLFFNCIERHINIRRKTKYTNNFLFYQSFDSYTFFTDTFHVTTTFAAVHYLY